MTVSGATTAAVAWGGGGARCLLDMPIECWIKNVIF